MSLKDSVVLVTGAARGIGAATARLAAQRGARVALLGLEPELLAALARELGPGHFHAPCDVTDQAELEAGAGAAASALGGIDAVVANAGIACRGTVGVAPVEAQVRTLEVNLVGVLRTVVATLPFVTARRGHYALVSSASAFAAMPGMAAYAASKAGVEQFGNVLRLELAHRGVTVGVVHPAWIDTDLVRDTEADLPTFRATIRSLPGPFGRITTVEACAAAIVEGIERRRRRVYIPASLAPFAALRQLFTGRLAERLTARQATAALPRMDEEAAGRPFGEHSVEAGGPAKAQC